MYCQYRNFLGFCFDSDHSIVNTLRAILKNQGVWKRVKVRSNMNELSADIIQLLDRIIQDHVPENWRADMSKRLEVITSKFNGLIRVLSLNLKGIASKATVTLKARMLLLQGVERSIRRIEEGHHMLIDWHLDLTHAALVACSSPTMGKSLAQSLLFNDMTRASKDELG
ncbi:hypothetical protein BS50DRAFT_584252 [Corynespora cassiicola Philippines]|uniref:Uncharacterized protein n=1 Tax=Corynespora cassiicola Philippines TaxID=1448308 RepID=A0A2T2NZ00_CORCC|nr:hypothetical protein BS50DRAFT_584252 [Corynespora cassiicola Philippines]